MQNTSPQLISMVVTGIIMAGVIYLRVRRMRGTRPLKLTTLWVIPALFLAIAVLTSVQSPPRLFGWVVIAIVLLVGALLGWHRGRSIHIAVDGATGSLTQTASPIAILMLLAIVAIRFIVRSAAQIEGASPEILLLVSDCLIALGLGLFSVQRLEMYLRGRRLIRGAGEPAA